MQKTIKAASDGSPSQATCKLAANTTPFLLIKYMLECYDNMLQLMVMVWGEGYKHDPHTAGKVGASFPKTPWAGAHREGMCGGGAGGYAFGKVPQGGPRSHIGPRRALS